MERIGTDKVLRNTNGLWLEKYQETLIEKYQETLRSEKNVSDKISKHKI